MKVGDKLYCKHSDPCYELKEGDIYIITNSYIKNDGTYVIDIVKNDNDERWIHCCPVYGKSSILNRFYTDKEIRKMKIEKLEHENRIR